MANHGLSKEEWSARLDAYHAKLRLSPGFEGYGEGSVTTNCGWESWQGFFDDGYTPEEALDEDMTYWDD